MIQTSRLHQVVERYRDLLDQKEATAEHALNLAHAHVVGVIQPVLSTLYQEIIQKQAMGAEIPLSWLYEANRLATLLRLLEQQIDHYGALALTQTEYLQKQAVQLGLESAQAQLEVSLPAGLSWSFGLPSDKARKNLVGATQKGSPLADLFHGFGKEASEQVKQALITGITLGHNPRVTVREVQQALGISRSRALTIARTEMLRSYRLSALETYRENADVCTGWIWFASLDRRTCLACILMHGTEHSLDEELNGHPNCRCVKVPKVRSFADILGKAGMDGSHLKESALAFPSGQAWFDQQDEATQRDIVGSQAAYNCYASGAIPLSAFVGIHHSQDWGKSIYQRSLKEIQNEAE